MEEGEWGEEERYERKERINLREHRRDRKGEEKSCRQQDEGAGFNVSASFIGV